MVPDLIFWKLKSDPAIPTACQEKLMLKISLKLIHHKPNGSMIHQLGPKVSMTFRPREIWSSKSFGL